LYWCNRNHHTLHQPQTIARRVQFCQYRSFYSKQTKNPKPIKKTTQPPPKPPTPYCGCISQASHLATRRAKKTQVSWLPPYHLVGTTVLRNSELLKTLMPARSQESTTESETELILSPLITKLSQQNALIPRTLGSQIIMQVFHFLLYLQRFRTPTVTVSLPPSSKPHVTPLPTITFNVI